MSNLSKSSDRDSDQDNNRQFQFRIPPAESQIALVLIAAMLGVFSLQSEALGSGPVLLLAAMFVGGFWTRRSWLIYLMLGILIWLNYFVETPYMRFDSPGLSISDVVGALVMILLSAACFRFFETERFVQTFYPTIGLGEAPRSGIRFEFPSLLGGRWWAIPVAVFIALILMTFPLGQPLRQLGIRPTASRLIFLILLLFFTWFVCRAIIGIFIRWRMKPEQADIQCRSFVASELWKDTWAIERRRAKQRARK